MARTTVTGNMFTYEHKHSNIRQLRCPMGCEYSATAGDYWNAKAGHKFTCTHDGETYPCELVERANVSGTDSNGRAFYGHVWVTITENATIEDLEA